MKILAILILLSITGSGLVFGGYKAGSNAMSVKMTAAIAESRKTQSDKIETLIAMNEIKEETYAKEIKSMRKEAAKNQTPEEKCANVNAIISVLDGL